MLLIINSARVRVVYYLNMHTRLYIFDYFITTTYNLNYAYNITIYIYNRYIARIG